MKIAASEFNFTNKGKGKMKINLKPIAVQVAVVFGASSGIGRLTALEMAKRGAKVCVAARSVEGLKSLVEEIEADGGDAFYVEADAADFEQVKAVADKCVTRYGRIDSWIHTAAAFLFGTVEECEPDEYKRMIEVNLLGQIYGAKAALPFMKKNGGALIHLTSVEAVRTAPFQSAYGASKHGIHGFLQVLRVELAHDKIPVVVTEVLPAAINTPIYEKGRNKMPFKMRPVPPIYHPQVVTDAILYAAENPTREIVAGGAGLGVVIAEKISPRAADFFSETVGFAGQDGGEKNTPEQFTDNLFAPVSGYDTVEGNFSDEQFMSDPYTSLMTSPRAKNSLMLGAVGVLGGFLAWRYLSKNRSEPPRVSGRVKV
jgi:NAD(P)-dependent dehydrogenase (short-subunit alcohol dehydrogenase family)